jgi:phosphohistidine swiveling domain-containing protein
MLERDILVRFIAAMKRCHEHSGFGFGQDSIRFVGGYAYTARSEEPEQTVSARRQAYVARIRKRAEEGVEFYEDEIRPLLRERIAALKRARRSATSVAAAVDCLEGAMDAAADAMGNLHWRMWDPTPFDWPAAYEEITARPRAEASVLLQGVGHDTARLVARLRSLARDVQSEPGLRDAIAAGDGLAGFPRFGTRFAKLLRDHGRRTGFGAGSNATFETPTWSMRPRLVLDIIGSFAQLDLDAAEEAEGRAKRERTQLARCVRGALRANPERLAPFERAYRRAIHRVQWGENSNHLIEQETVGLMREAIAALGTILVHRGSLDDADDVYHIGLAELHDVRVDTPTDFRDLVAERRAEVDRLASTPPPRTVGKPPPATPRRARADALPDWASPGVLQGVGVSRGRVTARARVVPPTTEPPNVEPGDILVARNAGPAWTPIFPLIAGLVLDAGALQDHAAIMARDLGIPAVMQVPRATSLVPDGAVVTVDGADGSVQLDAGA